MQTSLNWAYLVAAWIAQVLVGFFASWFYFGMLEKVKNRTPMRYRVMEQGMFLIYILIVLPFCFSFLFWVEAQVKAAPQTPNGRTVLIIVSVAGLVASAVYGKRRAIRSSKP